MRKPLRWVVMGGLTCLVVAGAGIALSGTASCANIGGAIPMVAMMARKVAVAKIFVFIFSPDIHGLRNV